MNQRRRKWLEEISERLSELKDELEVIQEEEYKENIPKNLQGSERYEKAEESVDQLEEAVDGLSDILELIEDIAS